MKFTAIYVDAYSTDVTANVMFADPETNPDQSSVLSFSHPIEPGFENSAYYFEINDQSYGSYGGLTSVRLTRNSLEVRVEAGVIEKFGEADFQEIAVEFNVDDQMYQSIRETLQRIFLGFEVLKVE